MGIAMYIQATIFFEKRYWIGTFERTDKEGYAVARHIFGGEPADQEIYDFVLHHLQDLKFGSPKEFTLEIRRMNPKRVQREVKREMERAKESSRPSTFAQDYLREELEKNKLEKKRVGAAEKRARLEAQFQLRQEKKKQKHRGH